MVLLYKEMFLVIFFKKGLFFCQVVKQQMQKNISVVFNFFQSTGRHFSLSDGIKAHAKNLLHWSSEIPLGEKKFKKNKKKHKGFFPFKNS